VSQGVPFFAQVPDCILQGADLGLKGTHGCLRRVQLVLNKKRPQFIKTPLKEPTVQLVYDRDIILFKYLLKCKRCL